MTERVEQAKQVYELAHKIWARSSPYRNTNRGHPGVAMSYSEELGYIEGAITTLREAKEGLMEEFFPKLREARLDQERYWDRVTPGDK